MRRNRACGRSKIGWYFVAFGLGMLVSLWCPHSVTVAVLSIVIVILGITVSK